MPKITKISQMWALLDVITCGGKGHWRRVNHLNEWGGFSRYLGLPVFTAWRDHTEYDKAARTTTAIVSDSSWIGPVGVNNQERWVDYALAHGARAAFFIIHAADEASIPRSIAAIDTDRVVIGDVRRQGTQTLVTGQPVPIDMASAQKNGRSSNPEA